MSIRQLVCPVLKPPQRLTIYKMNKVVRFLDYWKKFITFEKKQIEIFCKKKLEHNGFPSGPSPQYKMGIKFN